MKPFLLLCTLLSCALAQQLTAPSTSERDELRRALAEANTSEIEVLRVIEHYLAVHPETTFRPDLEHRAAEAAIAIRNTALIVRYGEASLARVPDDTKLLPAVTQALLSLETPEAAEHALKLARHAESLALQMQNEGNPGNINPIEWRNQTDLLLNRALTDAARATGILGKPDEALATAYRAFDAYPDASAAREIAFWLERLNRPDDAIRSLADAFTIPDEQASAAERAKDRLHLGELYRKTKGSEEGLGALCLKAYDRTAAVLRARGERLHLGEPNAGRTSALQFVIPALDGQPLVLATLKGKVVVMDLWATWCIPCREQHPLYEKVKQRFRDNPSVVFLSVNADPDRKLVRPFLDRAKWEGPVYFEHGLARLFSVEGLPATIILDPRGELYTHINGFLDKDHFAELLTERIRDALQTK